jgi:SAM-dependent methyltransferase
MKPKDHFSGCSGRYAAFRPRCPRALFCWLADLAPARRRAWDCACGSGQASLDLVEYFDQVVATDLSDAQLQQAAPHPRIDYRVATAEASGLPDASIDLVTVAQALHWFDTERFYAEARRVLQPAGLLAVWSYGVCHVDLADADRLLQKFYREVVGPYWPPERRHVESGYRSLPFPQSDIAAPHFDMSLPWTLDQLLGYVGSWSATAACICAGNADPLPALGAALAACWGGAEQRRPIRWPLIVRAARAAPEAWTTRAAS